jgi:hypothetical protein
LFLVYEGVKIGKLGSFQKGDEAGDLFERFGLYGPPISFLQVPFDITEEGFDIP